MVKDVIILLCKLLRVITSTNKGDYYCLTTYTGRAENKHKSHEDACKNRSYSHTKVPEGQSNTLRF